MVALRKALLFLACEVPPCGWADTLETKPLPASFCGFVGLVPATFTLFLPAPEAFLAGFALASAVLPSFLPRASLLPEGAWNLDFTDLVRID